MSNFVGDDELEKPPHQFIGKGKVLCARVEGGRLHEVPVPEEVLDVVVELDVRFKNLSRAWIVDVRALGVFNVGRQPAND